MIERMNSSLPLFLWVINSILLALYYRSFLTPKSEKIPGLLVFAAFGGTYFVSQHLVNSLLSGLQGTFIAFGITVVLIILVFALSQVFFKGNLRLNIFLLLSFFAVQEICEFILLSIGQSLGNAHRYLVDYLVANDYFTTNEGFLAFTNGYAIFQFFISLLIYAAIVAFTLRAVTKRFIHKNYSLSASELSYLLLPCLPGIAITHIIRVLIVRQHDPFGIYETYKEVPFIDFLVPLSGFILLLCMIAAVMFFQKLAQLHNEEVERSVLQKQASQFRQQVNDVDDIYTEIKGLRHDVKSHISNILILANEIVEGNTDVKDELDEYLKKIGETLDKFEFTYKTGNTVSDIIIHQKHQESTKYGIDFTADFIYPVYLNLDAYDVAIILINTLDNAIEACAKMKSSQGSALGFIPFIRLCTYIKGEMLFIEVENSFDEAVVFDKNSGLPISSKPDKSTHGMGLSNIRRCAGKYFGDIDIQITEAKGFHIFRLTVMLQGRVP